MADIQKNDQELRREEELNLLEQAGINPYPYSFDKTHNALDILNGFNDETPEEFASVSIAGRIMSIRKMGKASFFHILDQTGKIQVYIKRDDMPEFYEQFKLYDIGDIVGVNGFGFRTRTGEVSVHSKSVEILCKSLKPLPVAKEEIDEDGNKIIHDAFADKELRYRRRYMDMIVNSNVRETFIKRSKILSFIRRFLDDLGYLEVETPTLQPLYGGASARPFITHHNALDVQFYLRIALELYLKRLIVGGYDAVYEIGKTFRNEGMDRTHNPEFSMLELYVAYHDYMWMLELTEQLISETCVAVNNTTEIEYDEKQISLARPFKRAKMFDLYKEHTGFDLKGKNKEQLAEIAGKLNIHTDKTMSTMKILDEIFKEKVEPHLIQPTFVLDYPVEMSPLAKKHRSEDGLVERFELFINGAEIANCFSELNDSREQRARLEEQARNRAAGDDEAMVVDEDFLLALEVGMPPAAGLGVGIDRLVMLLTGETSIRDVLFFPHLKPEKK